MTIVVGLKLLRVLEVFIKIVYLAILHEMHIKKSRKVK